MEENCQQTLFDFLEKDKGAAEERDSGLRLAALEEIAEERAQVPQTDVQRWIASKFELVGGKCKPFIDLVPRSQVDAGR